MSNALFGSARDMGRLARMLLARGELDGVRVLSRASVELMLGSARAAATAGVLPTECMAMTAFGLGIGWCSDHTAADAGAGALGGTDDCRAPDWYGWAGSYGSRFALMHTRARARGEGDEGDDGDEGDEGGVYCAQSSNIPLLPGNMGECRRHHAVAHELVAAMRSIWPRAIGDVPKQCHALPPMPGGRDVTPPPS